MKLILIYIVLIILIWEWLKCLGEIIIKIFKKAKEDADRL